MSLLETPPDPPEGKSPEPPAESPLASFGFAGERKALALLCLAFYTAFYGLLSLLLNNAPPDQPEIRAWWACFAALGGLYGLSFFSVAANWFWARWFAVGLGYSGLTVALWGMFTQRAIDPVMLFYGATHGAIALFLQGSKLAAEYEGKPGWRERFRLDDNGVNKVRQTVTRAASSLPTLILLALAPREGAEGLLVVAGVGLLGVLLLRTWGVLLLLGAGVAVPLVLLHAHAPLAQGSLTLLPATYVHQLGLVSAVFLCAASVPFLRPVVRFVTGRAA